MKPKKTSKAVAPDEYTEVIPRTPVTPRQKSFLDSRGPGTFAEKFRRFIDKCIDDAVWP